MRSHPIPLPKNPSWHTTMPKSKRARVFHTSRTTKRTREEKEAFIEDVRTAVDAFERGKGCLRVALCQSGPRLYGGAGCESL